jgi:hypothetical protein
MNPTEIFEALEQISDKPFDPEEFPFEFAQATDVAQAAIAKLRNGTTNKSDQPGGVLVNKKFHFAPAMAGLADVTLEALRNSKKTATAKPAILIATDGEMVAAQQRVSGETLHCRFDEIGDKFGFFLPAAGKERYEAAEENPIDVKVTAKLAKLYDALVRKNPDWASDERRHEMNQLMMRLIFCMFAEDVGIFPDNQFSQILFNHAGNKGEEAREVIIASFTAMNQPKDKRSDLPAWAGDLEYVNGGLFAGSIDAPVFDVTAYRYLRDACGEDWREINPDIFGSMIQSVADPKQRSELGMHYTSVPNIMKVIGPLFLDDLDAEIVRAWERPNGLRRALTRIEGIRVFDPACGSGNFLVVSYRQLREREMRILQRLEELTGESTKEMFSAVKIANFHGIEITDFAAETAKLALFIAEYQANAVFKEVFGQGPASLPLRESAHIVCGNALRVDWKEACPPPGDGEEVFITGNPPFRGKAKQDKSQKADMDFVFKGHLKRYRSLDYVTPWYFKAALYIRENGGAAALVATSSICQGASVPTLWPHLLVGGVKVFFAVRPFKWRNNAAKNAAVSCIVAGIARDVTKRPSVFDGDLRYEVTTINGYLIDSALEAVRPSRKPQNGLPEMSFGNMAYDDGGLILSPEEKFQEVGDDPRVAKFVRKYVGSQEVVKGIERYCLWIEDSDLDEALSIPFIAKRIEETRKKRLEMDDDAGRDLANRAHSFREQKVATERAVLVPRVTSERRLYLPVDLVSADVIANDNTQVLYDAPEWCVSLVASQIHRVWVLAVCGQLESRVRYSKDLGWNTFPVPNFSEDQLETLNASARKILKCRYSHYPATIAELYDPDKMPDDLRAVHRENDELLETMYIGRPFRNDTERLEHLFKLYAARIRRIEKQAAKGKRGKRSK